MTRARGWRSRFRRPKAVYSDRDARVWRRLAETAARVARDPTTDKTGAMAQAAHQPEVVMPPDHQGKDSPFAALQALARRWTTLDADERPGRAAELADLAARCAEILDPAPVGDGGRELPTNTHVRERHRRADIDD